MRSGRLDRKIEFPHPNEDARAKILRIHSRKMNVAPDVNFEELARSSDDFNAAQLKAVRARWRVFVCVGGGGAGQRLLQRGLYIAYWCLCRTCSSDDFNAAQLKAVRARWRVFVCVCVGGGGQDRGCCSGVYTLRTGASV
jgi:hypothetical protein